MSILLALLLASAPDPTVVGKDFEGELIARSLEKRGLTVDLEPEGKTIDAVLVSSEEILGDTDPWPSILNYFHWRTQEEIVRREVLLAPGDAWQHKKVEEIERNLRRMVIFAVTRVVAIAGAPGHVSLMVVTKDRWSLNLNSEFNLVGNLLEYGRLRPAEMNFLGRNIQAALDLLLKLDTLDTGQYLLFPRLFGEKLRLAETADLVFNRRTHAVEGTVGYLLFDRPFYSLDQRWSFQTYLQWNSRTQRIYQGASIYGLDYPDSVHPVATVPFVYNLRDIEADGTVTRRFGSHWLTDVTAGVFGYDTASTAPVALPPAQAQWLVTEHLPHTESAAGLTASVRWFEARFVVLKDIDTLQLSEDYQLGPLLQAGIRWAPPLRFASTSYLEASASLRYRWYLGGDLLSLNGAVAERFVDGAVLNQHYVFELYNYSPLLEGGRLVVHAIADIRENDLNNPQVFLGGDNGLRGTPPQALTGRNYVLGSVEYRSKAFEIATVYVSPTLFYDVGSAFDDRPVFTHTCGFGLRILLPQFNQQVVKINFGLVIGQGNPTASSLVGSEPTPPGLAPDFLNNPP